MLHILLYQPEIPPNTGNIIRLCANTGCSLHLVEPLGFELDDKRLRRAGLDYREFAELKLYPDLDAYRQQHPDSRLLALSTRGTTTYDQVHYQPGDTLVFGPETRGLPADFLQALDPGQRLRIPMRRDSRSLNLSNAVAIVTLEGLRQLGFPDMA